ncbi:BolA family transcriptional regulator [Alphaproteobacteria bacterium KMM 3653]|uniref:BolA family transcriptional regulator n=1 Tax=Harenicola maris TaxID=2841044 RepID=A0AAP2G2R0_9RHOB|nr:BolA family transcriptional regulator [Harenicola maris]
MKVAQEIEQLLKAKFDPQFIEVVDESALHSGHAGAPEGGESHFRVVMRAQQMGAMNRLARHRAIHAALGPDLIGRIHALALEISE